VRLSNFHGIATEREIVQRLLGTIAERPLGCVDAVESDLVLCLAAVEQCERVAVSDGDDRARNRPLLRRQICTSSPSMFTSSIESGVNSGIGRA
jgi:hypothetical protein